MQKLRNGLLLLSLIFSGCMSPAVDERSTGLQVTPDPTATPSTTTSGGVFLNIDAKWYDSSTYTSLGSCEVPFGSAAGSSQDCTFTMPEGQIYASDFKFTAGSADTTNCKFVEFHPYWYQASSTAGWQEEWLRVPSAATDCSVASPPANCYNGPAVDLVPTFPKATFLFFPTDINTQSSFTVTGPTTKEHNHTVRYIVNSNADPTQAVPGIYVGSSAWQDYAAVCRNEYYEKLYEVRVIIQDTDGPIDHMSSW